MRGGVRSVTPTLNPGGLICQSGAFRRGSMFGAINPPRRARGERRLGLIKRSVWEIKLKISHKIRGRGCSRCQARGRAGPVPPLPATPGCHRHQCLERGCRRRCPRTCRGAVPRSIPAGADSRCQGEGKGGDTPERKAAPAPPQNPAVRWEVWR